jgi:putative endonuclease
MNSSSVYIVTNKRNGTLYVGVTSNLANRIWQHKNKTFPGFTSKYGLDKLVYYENCSIINDAIAAEKKLKGLTRIKKLELIEKHNPNWIDLSLDPSCAQDDEGGESDL